MRDFLTKWKIIFIILLIYIPIFTKTSKELEFIILYYILISIFFFQIIYFNQIFYIDIKIIVYFLIGLVFIIIQILPIEQNLLKYLSPKSAYYLSLIENTNYYSISLNFFNTLKYLLIYLSACMIIIGIRNIIKTKRDLLSTYRFFFLITFFYIFYSYFSYLNHNKNLDGLSSTIINRNNFCFYLILCFISLLSYMNFFKKYFYHKKNDFIQFILSDIFIARIAIVLISIGIILTKSRSGNTTFLVILIFYFALDYLRNKKLTFTSKIIISIFFIDIFLINYFVGLNQVISRFAEINYTNEELRIDTFQFSFSNLKNFLFFWLWLR